MAAVAKSGTPSLSSVVPPQNCVIGSGLKAGAAIAAGDLVYIAAAGTVLLSNGTSADAAAKCDGIAVKAAPSGEAVDVYRGVEMRYGAGLTPGARLFVSAATPGGLSDVATTGGTAPVGFVVDATRIFIHGSSY